MRRLNADFQDSIRLNKGQYFEYQYDGLSPQKSYFVGDKLMFLELIHRGEYTEIEEKIIFDKQNNIKWYVSRYTASEYERKEYKDSLYVADFSAGNQKVFVNNQLVKYKEIDYQYLYNYILIVKKYTEKYYQKK